MVHCLGVPPATQVCEGHIARDLYISPRSVECWVKSFDATRNVSPKESRHVPSRKLSEFEELFFRLCSIAQVSICMKCRVSCLK